MNDLALLPFCPRYPFPSSLQQLIIPLAAPMLHDCEASNTGNKVIKETLSPSHLATGQSYLRELRSRRAASELAAFSFSVCRETMQACKPPLKFFTLGQLMNMLMFCSCRPSLSDFSPLVPLHSQASTFSPKAAPDSWYLIWGSLSFQANIAFDSLYGTGHGSLI